MKEQGLLGPYFAKGVSNEYVGPHLYLENFYFLSQPSEISF